jgi:hypothetical protein
MANKTDFQVVDISMKITNQLPKVIITDEGLSNWFILCYKVL